MSHCSNAYYQNAQPADRSDSVERTFRNREVVGLSPAVPWPLQTPGRKKLKVKGCGSFGWNLKNGDPMSRQALDAREYAQLLSWVPFIRCFVLHPQLLTSRYEWTILEGTYKQIHTPTQHPPPKKNPKQTKQQHITKELHVYEFHKLHKYFSLHYFYAFNLIVWCPGENVFLIGSNIAPEPLNQWP